jgi:hypothetical protein
MSLLDKAVILPIQVEDIGHYKEIAIPFIKMALDQTDGDNSLEGILSDLDNRNRQLWLVKSGNNYIAAVVTMIYVTSSNMKIGEITLAGGKDYALWDHYSDVVGDWMREKGCQFIQVIGRAGWERLLAPKGFVKRYTVFRKVL